VPFVCFWPAGSTGATSVAWRMEHGGTRVSVEPCQTDLRAGNVALLVAAVWDDAIGKSQPLWQVGARGSIP